MKPKFNELTLALAATALFAHTLRAQNLSSDDLPDRALVRRAVEAVIWGMSAVNFDLMHQVMFRDAKGAGSNTIVSCSKVSVWEIGTLTPNPDGAHSVRFSSTKEVGPPRARDPGGSLPAG